MELVNIRNAEGGQHDEQNEMAQDEVAGEITQFCDLTQEFTARLGH